MFLHINEYLLRNKDIIELWSNIFISIGTISAVIVALWLSRTENRPQLKVYSLLGVNPPDTTEHLWLSCVNVSKQPVVCINFSFNPNRFRKKGLRAIPNPEFELKNFPNSPEYLVDPPRLLKYSDRLDQHFDFRALFCGDEFKKLLSKHKWLAALQLRFLWSVAVTTNIQEFNGNLSKTLVEKIIRLNFSGNTPKNKQ